MQEYSAIKFYLALMTEESFPEKKNKINLRMCYSFKLVACSHCIS